MDAYLAFRAAGAILPHIPQRLGYALTGWLADALYSHDVRAARDLRDNICHAMGTAATPDHIHQAARRAYRVLLQNYLDMFRVAALTDDQLREVVEVVNWEIVESAWALGRGVLLCSAHLGHVEAGLQMVALNGLPVTGLAEHVQPERLYQYLVALRTRHGVRFIPTDGPMLELFRALRRNEGVGTMLDRDTTGSGVHVELCGAPARVPDGYAHIAAKLRTPLVVGFCYRLPGGRAQIKLEASFVPDVSARTTRDTVYHAALDFGVRQLERVITTQPDQWVLTTPIWMQDIT